MKLYQMLLLRSMVHPMHRCLEAIQSVQEGQSIKLLQDINLTASIDVKDKTFH